MGAEVNRGADWPAAVWATTRMEIGSHQQEDQASRNNVVDFDFLFEFSPERRAEADPHFIQDQAQQGGVGEAERGASRRAEVRPYPNPEMRSTNKLEKSRQSARECRARKKLRYQYLDDMILEREKANDAL